MSQKRILMNLKTSDLEQLFLVAVQNADTEQLIQLQHELTHRTRKNATLLLGKVSEVLDRSLEISKPQSQLEKIKQGMTKNPLVEHFAHGAHMQNDWQNNLN